MLMVLVGVLLLVLKVAEIGPFSALSWWWVALPFGAAVLWWHWADASGLTRKREMDKLDQRKEDRRRKNMVALGLDPRAGRKTRVFRQRRAAAEQQVEAQRDEQRQKNRATVSSFHPDSRQGQEGPGRS